MNPQKHFRSLPFLITTFILLFGFSLWWYMSDSFKVSMVTNTNETVEDWKIYKNDELKFSIIFPESWKGYKVQEKINNVKFGFEVNGKFEELMSISKMSKAEWNLLQQNEIYPQYITEKDGEVYVFTHANGDLEVVNSEVKAADFDSIISTFKFIDFSETSDWKTYKNEEYGFEFKYPETWTNPLNSDLNSYNKSVLSAFEFPGQYFWVILQNSTLDKIKDSQYQKNIIVSGKSALKTYDVKSPNSNPTPVIFTSIQIGDNKIIFIEADSRGVDERLLDQILSTFKFTKVD